LATLGPGQGGEALAMSRRCRAAPPEMSLAIRTNTHPADKCGAFPARYAEGMPAEDIAARFGVTPAVVLPYPI
jgi:hypothetical protein